MTLSTRHAGQQESWGEYSTQCGQMRAEEGLAIIVYVLDCCPMGEWSKQMLIGCLGTGNTKARQLPDKDSQKDALPEILATTIIVENVSSLPNHSSY